MDLVIASSAGVLFGHLADLFYPRFFRENPIAGPPVRCTNCDRRPDLVELVPFVGPSVNGMRCQECGQRIPPRAVVLPLGAGLLALLCGLEFEELAVALVAAFFAAVLLTLSVTDLETHLLPNRLIYPSTVLAVAASWIWPDSTGLEVLVGGLVAVVICGVILLTSRLFGAEAFGMGDVKIIILMGFLAGFPAILVGVFIGLVAGAVAAAILVVSRRKSMTDYLAHGPYLALGGFIALLYGNEIWDAYRG